MRIYIPIDDAMCLRSVSATSDAKRSHRTIFHPLVHGIQYGSFPTKMYIMDLGVLVKQ